MQFRYSVYWENIQLFIFDCNSNRAQNKPMIVQNFLFRNCCRDMCSVATWVVNTHFIYLAVSPRLLVGSCYSIFSFICMFCRSLFVLLSLFFCPLCCLLFFDLQILIAPLVSFAHCVVCPPVFLFCESIKVDEIIKKNGNTCWYTHYHYELFQYNISFNLLI